MTPDTPDFTACPNWGKGGRYVVDPTTGRRMPVAREGDPREYVGEATGIARQAVTGDTLTDSKSSAAPRPGAGAAGGASPGTTIPEAAPAAKRVKEKRRA